MESINLVKVFLSSPSDCDVERQAIEKVVEKINVFSRYHPRILIKVIDWVDLYPGIGEYPQDVINKQLTDYDIYVGIWRNRLGTPTPKASSGTLEELSEALLRFERTRRPWVMCYFLQNSSQDFSQIKDQLNKHGCLYHHFEDSLSFERMFEDHIITYLQQGYRRRGESTTKISEHIDSQPDVCIVLNISSPGKHSENISFYSLAITVGRSRDKNDIILTDQRVHREQGIFVWQDGEILYVDLAGDSAHINGSNTERNKIENRGVVMKIGDEIELPDRTRITLRAIVD